jgi:hypothetical protein
MRPDAPGARSGRKPRIPGILRNRIPNTRGGAAIVAGGLLALGFAFGATLLLAAPMVQGREGVFALLGSPASRAAFDPRLLQPAKPRPLEVRRHSRPNLWQTPVAERAFPSEGHVEAIRSAVGVTSAVYEPATAQWFTLPNPIRDATGRSKIVPTVSLGVASKPTVAGPLRPDDTEPTQVTVAAIVAGEQLVPSCILAYGPDALEVLGASEPATVEGCLAGEISLPGGDLLNFAVRYDELPNYRARDGAWRIGGVFGRTEVWVAPGSAAGSVA